MQYAVCSMQYAVCSMQYAVCSMQYAVSSMQYAVCSMQYAVCSMQHALFLRLSVLWMLWLQQKLCSISQVIACLWLVCAWANLLGNLWAVTDRFSARLTNLKKFILLQTGASILYTRRVVSCWFSHPPSTKGTFSLISRCLLSLPLSSLWLGWSRLHYKVSVDFPKSWQIP